MYSSFVELESRRRVVPVRGASHAGTLNRRGATIIEITVAMLVLLVFIASVTKTLIAVKSQSRHNDRRLVAMQEASNVMERVFASPWDELTPARFSERQVSEEAKTRLPEVTLTVDMSSTEQPVGKRIIVKITWTSKTSIDRQSLQLAAWRFRSEETP